MQERNRAWVSHQPGFTPFLVCLLTPPTTTPLGNWVTFLSNSHFFLTLLKHPAIVKLVFSSELLHLQPLGEFGFLTGVHSWYTLPSSLLAQISQCLSKTHALRETSCFSILFLVLVSSCRHGLALYPMETLGRCWDISPSKMSNATEEWKPSNQAAFAGFQGFCLHVLYKWPFPSLCVQMQRAVLAIYFVLFQCGGKRGNEGIGISQSMIAQGARYWLDDVLGILLLISWKGIKWGFTGSGCQEKWKLLFPTALWKTGGLKH